MHPNGLNNFTEILNKDLWGEDTSFKYKTPFWEIVPYTFKDWSPQISSLFVILQNLKAVKLSHDAVLAEMENLNKQLQLEQSKSLSLQTELKSTSSSSRAILEVQC